MQQVVSRARPQQQDGQTSFNSYTFTYNWRIDDLETKQQFSSSSFGSPRGVRPATNWMLTLFNDEDTLDEDTPPSSPGERSLSATLKRLPVVGNGGSTGTLNYGGLVLRQGGLVGGQVQLGPAASLAHSTQNDITSDNSKAIWVEARLRSQPSNFDDLTEFEATPFSQGPTELSSSANSGTCILTFEQCIPLFKVQDSRSIVVECVIKVSPEAPPPLLTNKHNFSLSRFMEEARQNDLFTDVVLVAEGKEYKAHKVVLASQSQFFKTRFADRWVSPTARGSRGGNDRVSLTDVPGVIMEAMLAYMYTGKVEDIGNIAQQLLPAAEEYGLVGLRQLCEEELIQSLTSKTVVNMLIHAADHNAPGLKKACIEFIVHNTAAVRQSEGWGKLREDQTHHELWVELLENIAENH
jgi:hypothetical protein